METSVRFARELMKMTKLKKRRNQKTPKVRK